MSSQDRLEQVLRDIHVMISKSEAYDTDRIIVSKNDIFGLIDRLNVSVYEIMDEYELTQQSRDRALRENKKEGDKIIWDASRQAEDIYAASVLYTDEALNHLQGIMEYANETVGKLYKDFGKSMREQQEMIRDNQMELKSQLQMLTDTEKYLRLIEERNKEIERERARRKGIKMPAKGSGHKAIKPEIKINEAYFRKAGIPLEPVSEEHAAEMEPLEDEGVIESTLKKVAEDVRQEVLEESREKVENDATDSAELPYSAEVPDLDRSEESYAFSADSDESEQVIRDEIDDDIVYETDDMLSKEMPDETLSQEQKTAIEDNIKVNLDAAYFKANPSAVYSNPQKGETGHVDPHTAYTDPQEEIRKADRETKINSDAVYLKRRYADLDEEYAQEMQEAHHGKVSLLDRLMGKKK